MSKPCCRPRSALFSAHATETARTAAARQADRPQPGVRAGWRGVAADQHAILPPADAMPSGQFVSIVTPAVQQSSSHHGAAKEDVLRFQTTPASTQRVMRARRKPLRYVGRVRRRARARVHAAQAVQCARRAIRMPSEIRVRRPCHFVESPDDEPTVLMTDRLPHDKKAYLSPSVGRHPRHSRLDRESVSITGAGFIAPDAPAGSGGCTAAERSLGRQPSIFASSTTPSRWAWVSLRSLNEISVSYFLQQYRRVGNSRTGLRQASLKRPA